MNIGESFLVKVICDRGAQLLVVLNLVVTVLIYFHKPRVPGFRYDYLEEPTYYRVFKTINVIPDSITGYLFYPIFQIFGVTNNMSLLGPLFHLVVLLLASLQWALIGFTLSSLIRTFLKKRVN